MHAQETSRSSLGFVVVMGLCAACEPTVATVRFPAPTDAAPVYGQVPFPSDAWREGGRLGEIPGLDAVVPLETAALQAHLSALDGFGTRPVVEIFVDGAVDPDTLADGVFVVGITEGLDRDAIMPWLWRLDSARNVIAGAPARGTVLEERQTYAIVVTDAVRGQGGRVARAAGFDALLAERADALPERWRATRAAADVAGRLFGPGHVLAVSAFTVQSARTPLLRAREILEELPPPTITFADASIVFAGAERLHALLGDVPRNEDGREALGWSSGTGLAHEHVGVIGSGVLAGVSFRRPDLRGIEGNGPDSGTFVVDDDGTPRVIGAQDIPVTIMLPAAPPPPGGYPVALFGHGLGGSRSQAMAFVETAARAGWALVAIDASGHGSRFNADDDENNIARNTNTFAGDARLRDGFGDVEGIGTAFALFHDMRNLAAMRDEMRQSVLDLSQVVLALRNSALDLSALRPDAPGTARVDGDTVVYLGESFGGVLGATFAATEPHVRAYFLDVPGGGVLDMAGCHSPQLRPMITLYVPSLYGVDGAALDRFHPLIGLGSAILDGTDPLSFARHTLRDRLRIGGARLAPRHVVLVMVEGDEVLANSATVALAKTLGIPMLAPNTDAHGLDVVDGPVAGNVLGQTAVVVQQSPATHGRNWTESRGDRKVRPFGLDDTTFEPLEAVVTVQNPIEETHEQVTRFLDDVRARRVPRVEVHPTPRRDFDDDGVLDADDDTPFGP